MQSFIFVKIWVEGKVVINKFDYIYSTTKSTFYKNSPNHPHKKVCFQNSKLIKKIIGSQNSIKKENDLKTRISISLEKKIRKWRILTSVP